MKTPRILAASLAAVALVGLAACNNNKDNKDANTAKPVTKTSAATPTNANCPLTNKPVNASATREYKGQTVAFCCNGCASKFDAMSDADKAAKVASMKK